MRREQLGSGLGCFTELSLQLLCKGLLELNTNGRAVYVRACARACVRVRERRKRERLSGKGLGFYAVLVSVL